MSSGSPFGEVRLLTVERARLFTRTAEGLAEEFCEVLGRWLSDVSVVAGEVVQSSVVDLVSGVGVVSGADAGVDAAGDAGDGAGVDGDGGVGVGGGVDVVVLRSLFAVSHGVVVSGVELALGVVGLLCGGVVGSGVEVGRGLSRLEMGVFDLVLGPLVELVVEGFLLDPVELGSHVSGVAGLPAGQVEPVVGVPFHVSVGGVEGVVMVGLTASMLQRYSEELDRRIAGQLAARSDVPSVEIVRAVHPVVVELVVGFGLLSVGAGELVGLRVGDVLRTCQSVSRPLVARVGGEPLFEVVAAQRGQRLVAEVSGFVDSHLFDPGSGLTDGGSGDD